MYNFLSIKTFVLSQTHLVKKFMKLKNIILAAELIAQHAAQGHSVAICSDFDVDGLSSASLVANFLQDAGIKFEAFVPDRPCQLRCWPAACA